jgi:hypothetical protein
VDTVFLAPLIDTGHLEGVNLVNYQGTSFTYNQGLVSFVQTNSVTQAFNIRISIAGGISGGNAASYAHISFPTLPISTNASWNIGARFSPGASQHLFNATLIDTVDPSTINFQGNLTFHVFVDNTFSTTDTFLNITSLNVEIAQLAS